MTFIFVCFRAGQIGITLMTYKFFGIAEPGSLLKKELPGSKPIREAFLHHVTQKFLKPLVGICLRCEFAMDIVACCRLIELEEITDSAS